MNGRVKRLEEFYLKVFKLVVLAIMSLALLAMVVLLVIAAQQYFQSPKEPAPAQKAPAREVGIEDLKRYLLDREKGDAKKDAPKQLPAEQTFLRYQEHANTLFRCVEEFGKKVEAEVVDRSDAVNAQFLQGLRSRLEWQANQSPFRGEPWVVAVASFTCSAMGNEGIIALKREGKLTKGIFYPIIEFHATAWDEIQREKNAFEEKERERVESQRAAELARVALAKAFAVGCLLAAASLFALFMLLALYLLAAKAECDLRDINESIRALRPQGVGE